MNMVIHARNECAISADSVSSWPMSHHGLTIRTMSFPCTMFCDGHFLIRFRMY